MTAEGQIITPFSKAVDVEIGRLSGLHFRSLRFSKEMEDAFEEGTRPGRCKRLWLEGLLAIGTFNLVLLAGQLSHPPAELLKLIRTLYVFTPLAMLVNFSMLLKPRALIRESSIAFVPLALGLFVLALELNCGEANALLAQLGVAIILIFSHSVMRLRFGYALTVSFGLASGEILFNLFNRSQVFPIRAISLCFDFAVLFFSAVANYSHNRQEKLSFLLCLRGDLLIDELHQENDTLASAADQDVLTGLSNRRAFDRTMKAAWEEAMDKGQVLAVILIDIDHFKRLNDTLGHLFGDQVLRRVSRLLQESLRKKDDFAARFGGEEFVILLPSTDLQGALIVAERLRNLVEVAGFPALENGGSLTGLDKATVSCGVAAGSPMQFETMDTLLGFADKALYRAKAAGKNRSCTLPEMEDMRLISGAVA